MGPGGLLPAYPSPYVLKQIYGYDDIQMLQSRLPMDYYGITFPAPAALTGRDGGLANNPYSGDVAKFGRGDSASPAPATTLAQPQQNPTQAHHTAQQPFLNPGLPPGYSYPGLSYYASMPGVPSAFPYGPTVFVPPTSAKHGVNLNAASTPFQQSSPYGQHGYATGVSVSSSNTGVPAGYAPAPFLHILPHQQAHSQMMHHHMQQDGQGVSGQRNQPNTMQQKSQANKTAYASSPYWTN